MINFDPFLPVYHYERFDIFFYSKLNSVPGNKTLAANLMARAWNSSIELQTVTTIGAARTVAQKWARNLLEY